MAHRGLVAACAAAMAGGVTNSPWNMLAAVAEGPAPTNSKPGADWAVKLPRLPATEPSDAAKTFIVKPDVRFEQVACEPQIVDPVAMAFDEAGALYVVEMRDYSEQEHERLGRVRKLADRDGDGVFETSTIFAQ